MASKPALKAGGIGALVLAVILVVGLWAAFVTVPEGYVGVEQEKGAASGEYYEPGWHVQNPVTQSYTEIETRPQVDNHKEVYAITEDGQDVWVDITIRYRVTPEESVTFFSEYKSHEQAQERVIAPTVRSTIRDEIGNTSARDIITKEERRALQTEVENTLNENVEGSGVTVEAAQIRNVKLNDQYAAALENVEIEETKAEQRVIEAESVAEANQIREESLSDPVLMEMYIESIDETDTVIMATGENGQPVIMDMSNLSEEEQSELEADIEENNE